MDSGPKHFTVLVNSSFVLCSTSTARGRSNHNIRLTPDRFLFYLATCKGCSTVKLNSSSNSAGVNVTIKITLLIIYTLFKVTEQSTYCLLLEIQQVIYFKLLVVSR